ncbi:hypothetical protein IMZ11_02610 [Microtetraspora sp. AC03309]|uniref:hypothetical protein n=1 Tax=Microtetraspora sp. AC03309 TaxID=2779376 RepID=UPI001E46E47A|nr:hypothetical protein [Microtetraspora sp. AC03309]MCC5574531.1 hypothetical protein [Microtetraspora sp. AC03309]
MLADRPPCEWCEIAPATEVLVRDRPSGQGGRHRASSFVCAACGDRLSRNIARIDDVTAIFRLSITPLIPASREAS